MKYTKECDKRDMNSFKYKCMLEIITTLIWSLKITEKNVLLVKF